MAGYSPIIPPSSLGETLRPLADLSDDEFTLLLAAISGPKSFSLPREEFERLRGQIATGGVNLPFLLSALSFLYSHILRLDESDVPFPDVINAMTDELDKEASWGAKKGIVRDRLAKLLEKRDAHQRFRKIQRLQSGYLPNALSFTTFVDLRPDFGEDDEPKEIKGYLPVIQFRISTDAPNADDRRIVVQMTENVLADLRKAIKRAEDKLKVLKDRSTLADQLIKA